MQLHEVELMGRAFRIRSEDARSHIEALAEYVNGQIDSVSGGSQKVAPQSAALLASLNMADELFKLRAEHQALKARIRSQSRALLARMGPSAEEARRVA